MLGLVANGSQKFAPESVEIRLGNQANKLIDCHHIFIIKNRTTHRLLMTRPLLLEFEFHIFYLFDSRSQIDNKTALVLFVVGKVFNFLLPDKIVESSAISLVHKSLSSEQDAITRHYVQLVKNDDVSRNKLKRANLFEPGVLTID